jgi:hypothetical protein
MVSDFENDIGNHMIAKELSLRLKTILNEKMDGYTHRADCYFSKNEEHEANSLNVISHNGKCFRVSIRIQKMNSRLVRRLVNKTEDCENYKAFSILTHTLKKFVSSNK